MHESEDLRTVECYLLVPVPVSLPSTHEDIKPRITSSPLWRNGSTGALNAERERRNQKEREWRAKNPEKVKAKNKKKAERQRARKEGIRERLRLIDALYAEQCQPTEVQK